MGIAELPQSGQETQLLAGAILSVAISTLGDNLRTIDLPAPRPEVCYLVVAQQPPADWRTLWSHRSDVTVIAMNGRGLSRSRNCALQHVETPLFLVADDDLALDLDAIIEGARYLFRSDDVEILAGMLGDGEGGVRHAPLPAEGPFDRDMVPDIWSPEIMVKVRAVREADIAFDPGFGAGTDLPCGEETLFVVDCLDAGLRGYFRPLMFSAHPDLTTGERHPTWGVLSAHVRTVTAAFGTWAGIKWKVRMVGRAIRLRLPVWSIMKLAVSGHGRGDRARLSDETFAATRA